MDYTLSLKELHDHWNLFLANGDIQLFQEYIYYFIECFSDYIEIEFIDIDKRNTAPSLHQLSDRLINVIEDELKVCIKSKVLIVNYAQALVNCLIIIACNSSNIECLPNVAHQLLKLITSIYEQTCDGSKTKLLSKVFYFFELIYDPTSRWRNKRSKLDCIVSKPMPLQVEIIPFFYDIYNQGKISIAYLAMCIDLFGCIISGSKGNALKAVLPVTINITISTLLDKHGEAKDLNNLRRATKQCFLLISDFLYTTPADQRQIELTTFFESYIELMKSIGIDDQTLLGELLDTLCNMITCEGIKLLLIKENILAFIFEILHKTSKIEFESLVIALLKTLKIILQDCETTKAYFIETIGYERFLSILRTYETPSQSLVKALFSLSKKYETDEIGNARVASMLLEWIPSLNENLQANISATICNMCERFVQTRLDCCNVGMISVVVGILSEYRSITNRTLGELLKLLEVLGSLSLKSNELRSILKLMNHEKGEGKLPFFCCLMNSLSEMSRSERKLRNYLNFKSIDSGVKIPRITKPLSACFSFHIWLSLAPYACRQRVRRQLYSFINDNGQGFEAYFDEESRLVVAVLTKKEYSSVLIRDVKFTDNVWFSIDVVHTNARHLFSSTHLLIYIDSNLKHTSNLAYPSSSSEPYICNYIGKPSAREPPSRATSFTNDSSSPTALVNHSSSPTSRLSSLPNLLKLKISRGTSGPSTDSGHKINIDGRDFDGMATIPIGAQTNRYGAKLSIEALITSCCLLNDTISPTQITCLTQLGPNYLNIVNCSESNLNELASKMLFHYNAKACSGSVITDLSSNGNHGDLSAEVCTACDIKDAINSIGGLQVLFPILERLSLRPTTPELVRMTPTSQEPPPKWIIPGSSYEDHRLEKSGVSGFLVLLKNMLCNHKVNQEVFIQDCGFSILGLLFQKMEPSLIDVNVLMTLQLMAESFGHANKHLLRHIYHYVLFDFRVWCSCDFTVRIGHIQYLSTLIKNDNAYFRKQYGVQFFLDVISTYYCNSKVNGIDAEDASTIRISLLSLVKIYIYKNIHIEELKQIIAFILANKDEQLICEALDLLTSLLVNLNTDYKHDQLVALLYEQRTGEMLFTLLANPSLDIPTKEKVLAIIAQLCDTPKVSHADKRRLRLTERNLLPGLLYLICGHGEREALSPQLSISLFKQCVLYDTVSGYNGCLSILQYSYDCSVETKSVLIRQLLTALLSRLNCIKIGDQLCWQQILVRMLISIDSSPSTSKDLHISTASESTDSENPLCNHEETTSDNDDVSDPFDNGVDYNQSYLFAEGDDNDNFEKLSNSSNENLSRDSSIISLESSNTVESINSLNNILEFEAESDSDMIDVKSELNCQGLEYELSSDPVENLVDDILMALILICWRTSKNMTSEANWKMRGEIESAMNCIDEHHHLIKDLITLKRKFIDLLLQTSIIDLKANLTKGNSIEQRIIQNAHHLLYWIYNFYCLSSKTIKNDDLAELNTKKFNVKTLENLLQYLDLLSVWENFSDLLKIRQLGLSILLEFAALNDIELCSIATAKLHTLIQIQQIDRLQESCYIMSCINDIIQKSLKSEKFSNKYEFLIPAIRTLVVKCNDLLDMRYLVPNMPPTNHGPTFYSDFKTFAVSEEWTSFLDKQVYFNFTAHNSYCSACEVLPSKEQYMSNYYDRLKVNIKTELGINYEQMMTSQHLRSRLKGSSKILFENEILNESQKICECEYRRFELTSIHLANHSSSIQRQWRNQTIFQTGPSGVWPAHHSELNFEMRWKLSCQENLSRMRPRLVPNYNFTTHEDASRLRDNIEPEIHTDNMALLMQNMRPGGNIGDDQLADDEWNLINGLNEQNVTTTASKEQFLLRESCELVTSVKNVLGRFELTTTHMYFYASSFDRNEDSCDFKLNLNELREIHFRRFNLRRSAIEIFLISQINYFINFEQKTRNKVYLRILSLRPQNLIYYGSRSPSDLLKSSGLTQKWVQREISTFDYLMQLNTIAGRTYNDLSQYPVFPWILSDYKSQVLNLEDPKIYRDLSKPIGVLNPYNESMVKERYEDFEDHLGEVKKFHYGSHYSNSPGVMHYLIRLEPFTSLHIDLQGARFDVTDRQFHSIPSTWDSLYDSSNNVKELIPEFFYLPEFLTNDNNFDLGKLHNGNTINDVTLPPWANSPEDFTKKHMQALESDYVSSNIHNWIDLIFGYKQQGVEAVKAINVFYYCTYEGSVDLDKIENDLKRKSLEGIIRNFGQTPCQLLKEAHPVRITIAELKTQSVKLDRPLSLFYYKAWTSYYVEAATDRDPLAFVNVPVKQLRSFITHGMPDTMITITKNGIILINGWLPYDKYQPNYFTFERDLSVNSNRSKKSLGCPFAADIDVTRKLFAVTHDAKLIFSGGHWDNSINVYNTTKHQRIGHYSRHTDIVTCLALDSNSQFLITGSRDTTCMIWATLNQNGVCVGLVSRPVRVLYGHRDHITCVAMSLHLDFAASGSKDGTVVIHSVRKGMYTRTLTPPIERCLHSIVNQLAISDQGHICIYSSQHRNHLNQNKVKQDLYLYSINGKLLSSETLIHSLTDMLITKDYLIFGDSNGAVHIKEMFGLHNIKVINLQIPVTCLTVTNANSHILVALNDGKLIVIGQKKITNK